MADILTKRYWDKKPPLGATLNYSHPLSQSLVGAWLMNEGGGGVTRDITRNNNGTNVGTVWISSQRGKVLRFNGSNSYVNIPNSSSLQVIYPLTIVIWFKGVSFGGRLFDKETAGVGSGGFMLDTNNNKLRTCDTSVCHWSNTTLSTGIWNNAALVVPNNTDSIRFYLNGIFDGAPGSINYSVGTNPVRIGADSNGANVFNGDIAYALLYKRPLSPSEIQSLYVAPYQMIAPRRSIFYSIPETPATTTSIGIITKRYSTQKPPLGATLNYSHPLSRGLVGAWLMNEGGGNLVNDIAKKANGKLSNVNWVGDKNGIATNFYGATSKITGAWKDPGKNLSCFAIVNFTLGGHTYDNVFHSANTTNGWALSLHNGVVDLIWRFVAENDFSTLVPIAGEKSSIAVSFNDNSNIGIGFLNGKFQIKTITNIFTESSGGYEIGNTDFSADFLGKISCLYVYSRALSPSEIMSLYIAPFQMIKPSRIVFGYGAGAEPPVTTSGTPYGFLSLNTGYW